MITTLYILMAVITMMMAFMITAFVYSIVTTYKQTKTFINNLKVGDETNYGKISDLEGDYVVINREPLRIHRKDIQPKEFIANKHLFMFGSVKK